MLHRLHEYIAYFALVSRVQVMIDDYVLPSEPVVDFKTRFSGLVADDLDPYASRHHLVRKLNQSLKQ